MFPRSDQALIVAATSALKEVRKRDLARDRPGLKDPTPTYDVDDS